MNTRPDPPPTKHRPHPVSRAEFARRAGRSASSITEACAGPLQAACLPGGRIDAAHPAVAAWATKRGIELASLRDPVPVVEALPVPVPALAARRGRGRPKTVDAEAPSASAAAAGDYSLPKNVTDLLSLSLAEITDKHQSVQGFADWISCRRAIADTARVESRNARDAGRLISKELVRVHIFGLIEGQNIRLLTNAPRTIARRAANACRTGRPLEEIERDVQQAISAELRASKRQVENALRNCKTGDNPPEVNATVRDARPADTILARDIERRLLEAAAPAIVGAVLAAVNRAVASARGWDPQRFEAAWESRPQIEAEMTRQAGSMLAAHVAAAIRDLNAQEARQ